MLSHPMQSMNIHSSQIKNGPVWIKWATGRRQKRLRWRWRWVLVQYNQLLSWTRRSDRQNPLKRRLA
jgi:hypothetical protein